MWNFPTERIEMKKKRSPKLHIYGFIGNCIEFNYMNMAAMALTKRGARILVMVSVIQGMFCQCGAFLVVFLWKYIATR